MKHIITIMILALLMTLMLSACGCKHEAWNDATCDTPKTCAQCGATEGAPLGHEWQAADCENAKTCVVCKKTDGSALGHNWADATCEAPKTCQTCKLTEGEALGHDWAEATTEAPKTCKNCNATEGEKIITDPRFTTAACAPFFGKWACELSVTGEMMGLPDFEGNLPCVLHLQINNDGTMSLTIDVGDDEAFMKALSDYTIAVMYKEFADTGLDKDAANAAMQQQYGMTVEEYVANQLSGIDFSSLMGAFNRTGVYYVENDQFYSGDTWTKLESNTFHIDGDSFTLIGFGAQLGMSEEPVFVKQP